MFGIRKLADHTVLERIKQGDEKVLVYMYKEHYTMVKNFVLKNSGDDTVVEDILQDTVIAVWRNVNKSDFLLQSKLSTYVMAVAKNLWFKELKKRSKFTLVDEHKQFETKTESENIDVNIDRSIIVKMVEELDETCKRLLSYFYFDGFNNKVIAEKLGFANANTVKAKKYQCFKKLQKRVTEQYNKEDLL